MLFAGLLKHVSYVAFQVFETGNANTPLSTNNFFGKMGILNWKKYFTIFRLGIITINVSDKLLHYKIAIKNGRLTIPYFSRIFK